MPTWETSKPKSPPPLGFTIAIIYLDLFGCRLSKTFVSFRFFGSSVKLIVSSNSSNALTKSLSLYYYGIVKFTEGNALHIEARVPVENAGPDSYR